MERNQVTVNFPILPRLFEKISSLSENQQISLLKSIHAGRLSPLLFKLIIDLSQGKMIQLLDQLREMAGDEVPQFTIDLDERNTPRKPCTIDVDLATPDQQFRHVILDISIAGAFIETDDPLTTGQALSLNFSFPGSDKVSEIHGEIVRRDPKGVGVKFSNLNPLQRQQIKAIVDRI